MKHVVRLPEVQPATLVTNPSPSTTLELGSIVLVEPVACSTSTPPESLSVTLTSLRASTVLDFEPETQLYPTAVCGFGVAPLNPLLTVSAHVIPGPTDEPGAK